MAISMYINMVKWQHSHPVFYGKMAIIMYINIGIFPYVEDGYDYVHQHSHSVFCGKTAMLMYINIATFLYVERWLFLCT